MSKQDKYTKSAEDQECQIRIPGVCNGNNMTVVFAHIGGAGMGLKHPNIIGAYACSDCHDHVDGRATNNEYTYDELRYMHLEGMMMTQLIMIREGVLKL
jgi:Putative nuclease YbcO